MSAYFRHRFRKIKWSKVKSRRTKTALKDHYSLFLVIRVDKWLTCYWNGWMPSSYSVVRLAGLLFGWVANQWTLSTITNFLDSWPPYATRTFGFLVVSCLSLGALMGSGESVKVSHDLMRRHLSLLIICFSIRRKVTSQFKKNSERSFADFRSLHIAIPILHIRIQMYGKVVRLLTPFLFICRTWPCISSRC